MPKNSLFMLEELPGDQYTSLEDAQAIALPGLAADLAATVQGLLLAGILTRREGRIIPTPRKD